VTDGGGWRPFGCRNDGKDSGVILEDDIMEELLPATAIMLAEEAVPP